MTRTEFEEEFGIVVPGEAIGVTLCVPYAPGVAIRINFIGLRQHEIQELEKLYKLQGER